MLDIHVHFRFDLFVEIRSRKQQQDGRGVQLPGYCPICVLPPSEITQQAIAGVQQRRDRCLCDAVTKG